MPRITPLSDIIERYFKTKARTSQHCAGCGNGIIGQALARAVDRIGLPRSKVGMAIGSGCNIFITADFAYDQLVGAHGRAPAYATGLKLARPDLTVIVVAGDGDTGAIGGNHFIHAARRNIDITLIISNNFIYGRTGGQYGPTTPIGSITTTAPYGLVEPPIDFCRLAEASGATFVARGTTYHVTQLIDLIEKAILHKGFSVIDVINQCPESYGRLNPKRMGRTGTEMMKWMRDHSISVEKAKDATTEELRDKIIIGVFVDKEATEFTSEYKKTIQRVQEKKEGK
jgi:2-oxoglutarate ferredoxin oxidoreductase subunit beta